jgi:pyrroloquinoline quinone biosynthesis protein B
MLVRVLGSAAGGGFPQWNCGCANCVGVRSGQIKALPRTQESLAVSADGSAWFLINASPEIRQQIEAFPGLHPRALRDSPIAGIILTNGDLDHCLGLLSLRESQPLVVYATERVRRGFCEHNRLYRTLERFERQVTWHTLELGAERPLLLEGRDSGLSVKTLPVPGKSPLHLAELGAEPGDNVGLRITEGQNRAVLAYLPAVAGLSSQVTDALAGASAVFFDGTFWSNDELTGKGVGTRDAADMSHWPLGGERGSLQFLRESTAKRRVFIHINNTNPILRDDSPERAEVTNAGMEVAFDGMDLTL